MGLKELQHRIISKNYAFEGVPMFCTSGIHESIFDEFNKFAKNKNISILVLGSGAGAFEQRLISNGYANITSTEFNPEHFIPKGPKLLAFDLNEDFSNLGNFDAIIAIEIIEHIENQFHFIRCVSKNLAKDGSFFLSTPNAESMFSRFKYFTHGRLHYFGEGELNGTGHINPIFSHILKFNLEQNNLFIEKYFTNDNIWNKAFTCVGPLLKIAYGFAWLITRFAAHRNDFEINLFTIKHKQ